MPAPTNLDALTAIDIPAFPATIVQDVTDGLGTTYTVWYKFTAPAAAKVMSIFAFGGATGVGYQPVIAGFLGPASAPVQITTIAAENRPIFTQVEGGVEYFFRFTKNANVTPSELTLKVAVFNSSPIPVGAIAISADQSVTGGNDFPLCIVSAVNGDNYNVLDYILDYPAGEEGDVLPTGEILVWASFISPYNFQLYSSAVEYVQDVSGFTGTGQGKLRTCNAGNCWYAGFVGDGITAARVKRIDSTGVAGVTTFTLTTGGISALAANIFI